MPSADFPPGNSLNFERGSRSLTALCLIARSRKMSLRVSDALADEALSDLREGRCTDR
jgi:hypothetical protein